MKYEPGDKVWVKSIEEIKKAAGDTYELQDGSERYIFPSVGFDFLPKMYKYCCKQVTIKKDKGNDIYSIEEDDDQWNWASCWFSKDKPTPVTYVSDFGGTVEETTPAEVYWEQVMPQIKEIVINAYNKGVEIGKAEHI
jgi:hypothetical protein